MRVLVFERKHFNQSGTTYTNYIDAGAASLVTAVKAIDANYHIICTGRN